MKKILAVLAAVVFIPAGLLAWGPDDRPTYTTDKPANHVTFNSMTNNPAHGDERNFVQIKDAATSDDTYGEEVDLQPGKEYEVYVYYHNNAASNLNGKEHNHKGVARNAQMRVQMPGTVAAGDSARITGLVGADNAQPGEVWDEAYAHSDSNVALRVVPNSATIYSNGAVNGQKLPNSLFTTGTNLGYDKLDGNLPGCHEYAGFVTFRFKVDKPNFEVKKSVSLKGENDFKQSVSTMVGSSVEYKIEYKNTGTTQQDDVVIKDQLPKGVSYVPGTTTLANSHTDGYEKEKDSVTENGLNIGSYAPGGNAFIKFEAKVGTHKDLDCGKHTLVNKVTAETSGGNKHDTADVIVNVLCAEVPKVEMLEVCRLEDNTIIKISKSQFDASKHSKDLSDCKENPEIPSELPETGMGNVIAQLLGLGSAAAGVAYYVTNRRG